MDDITKAQHELINEKRNRNILLNFIAEFPEVPWKIEQIAGFEENTFPYIVSGKVNISNLNLIRAVNKLRKYLNNKT